MENFIDLMSALGELMDTELIPDLNQVVTIMINEKIMLNIELSVTGEKILLGSLVVELPPGRFREEVLKFALLANHASDTNLGTLAYISNHNSLVLLQEVYSQGLKATELYEKISFFVDRAQGWQNAINAGKPYPEERNEIPKLKVKSEGQKIFGF
jgi:hypothetical protein